MLGILLNMNGIPKRGEIEDLLLRWIVCGHEWNKISPSD